jgi:glycosyltransferase involved in cell wall biosynthesis
MTIVEVTAAQFGTGRSGGGERHAVEFISELARHEPVVFAHAAPIGSAPSRAEELPCPAHTWSMPPLFTETNPIPSLGSWGLVGGFLRSHRRELEFIHVHNLRTAVSTQWMLLAYLRKKGDGTRILLTDLGARFFPAPSLTARMADYYVPISRVSEQYLLDLAVRPSCVVPTAVSAPFLSNGLRPFDQRPVDLLFVGRIVPWKRPDRVLRLAADLKVRLGRAVPTVIAGAAVDPAFLADLRRRAEELKIGHDVTFVTGPTDEALIELYDRSKVYCMASDSTDTYGRRHRYPELSSITVLEAAARGTPALANRIPAAEEQVRDGVTGRLVDPFGGPACLQAAEDLLTSLSRWSRLSAGAHEFVASERTYPRTVASFREFLRSIREGAS